MGGIVTYVLELKRPSPPEPARTGSAVLQRRLASAAVGCPAGVQIAGSKSTRRALSGRAAAARLPVGPGGTGGRPASARATRPRAHQGRAACGPTWKKRSRPGLRPTRPTRGPGRRGGLCAREPVCWPFGKKAFV